MIDFSGSACTCFVVTPTGTAELAEDARHGIEARDFAISQAVIDGLSLRAVAAAAKISHEQVRTIAKRAGAELPNVSSVQTRRA